MVISTAKPLYAILKFGSDTERLVMYKLIWCICQLQYMFIEKYKKNMSTSFFVMTPVGIVHSDPDPNQVLGSIPI